MTYRPALTEAQLEATLEHYGYTGARLLGVTYVGDEVQVTVYDGPRVPKVLVVPQKLLLEPETPPERPRRSLFR